RSGPTEAASAEGPEVSAADGSENGQTAQAQATGSAGSVEASARPSGTGTTERPPGMERPRRLPRDARRRERGRRRARQREERETALQRPEFDKLTPRFPDERFRLEHEPKGITERIIDLIAPVGKGQRGMVVSPPKAGKTTVLKQIAGGILQADPETHVIILLVDERPEEVTDWQRTVAAAEVVYSTFDKPADQHTQITELVLERAKRLVEQGQHVALLPDSITRLARAYHP